MHGLRVKGMADAAAVAQRFALDRELVDELLLDYEAFGWITRVHFADVDGWSLTAPGLAENGRRLVAELDQTGARSKVVAAHEVFVALNSRFLVAITDRRSGRVEGISWQQMITPTCHGMPESCRVRREDAVYDVMEPTRGKRARRGQARASAEKAGAQGTVGGIQN
jgi:hypothetical protein